MTTKRVTSIRRPFQALDRSKRYQTKTLQNRYAMDVVAYMACTGSMSEHLRILDEQRWLRETIESRTKAAVRRMRVAA